MIRTVLLATTGTLAAVLFATPAAATVTVYSISGTFADGKVLGGSFTYDDSGTDPFTTGSAAQYSNITLTLDGALLPNIKLTSAFFSPGGRNAKGFNTQFSYPGVYTDPTDLLRLTFDVQSTSDFKQGILSSATLKGEKTSSLVGGGRTGHSLNAGATATATPAVAAVPEPATWALMLMGFGLTGAALRRRTRTRVTFA